MFAKRTTIITGFGPADSFNGFVFASNFHAAVGLDAIDAIDDEVVVAQVEAPEENVPEAVEEAPAPTVEAKPTAEPTPRQPTT